MSIAGRAGGVLFMSGDYALAARLAGDIIAHSCHGVVVAGTTGEAATLTVGEAGTLCRVSWRQGPGNRRRRQHLHPHHRRPHPPGRSDSPGRLYAHNTLL